MAVVSVKGIVATTPRVVTTETNQRVMSFRLAEVVEDGGEPHSTNWYTVDMWDQLARNSETSIAKGDRVVIVGDLYIRDWDNGERSGTSVQIKAKAAGHDLGFGTSQFERTFARESVNDSEYTF